MDISNCTLKSWSTIEFFIDSQQNQQKLKYPVDESLFKMYQKVVRTFFQ